MINIHINPLDNMKKNKVMTTTYIILYFLLTTLRMKHIISEGHANIGITALCGLFGLYFLLVLIKGYRASKRIELDKLFIFLISVIIILITNLA